MPIQISGAPPSSGSASSGPVRKAASTVSTTVMDATRTSGTANRTVRDSASTSPVLRVTRSPVPARSTVDSGRDSTFSR